ncbi:hypothetical protein BDK51DRAFT_47502 [Blyttiomyces helicus]|uniref:ADP-ribosylglycohydrolase-domain-containing protein n=1 Tax=Blyttiomyces helicus TaxID=388810 RepID=A0A4P9WNB4_9FUNG|nr:hypothetical protein BDK51DRAFT_47502 [Blyttiomyces helicus]|eukprot:RKO94589.1 hypothetical protein BDK51DRAFT_47502 [Blyttiomyces helicus]
MNIIKFSISIDELCSGDNEITEFDDLRDSIKKLDCKKFHATLGCMLSAAVSDAAGATLEFCRLQINQSDVRNTIRMTGGGVLGIEKGVITDDTGLHICLANTFVGRTPPARSVIRNQEVLTWFEVGLDGTDIQCDKMIGLVRWGFTLTFQQLHLCTSFENAIEDTLLKGVDTDTNAAIVGGLVSALHGEKAIPEFMKAPILQVSGKRKIYWAAHIPKPVR